MKKIILILIVSLAILGCQKNSPAPASSTSNSTATTMVWCIYKAEAPNAGVLLHCAKTKQEMQEKAQQYRDADIFVNVVGKTACSDC